VGIFKEGRSAHLQSPLPEALVAAQTPHSPLGPLGNKAAPGSLSDLFLGFVSLLALNGVGEGRWAGFNVSRAQPIPTTMTISLFKLLGS
jgi:hypothetical protein